MVSALDRGAFATRCREASALNGFCVPLCEDSARDLVDRSLGFSPAAGGAGGLAFRDGFLRFACVARVPFPMAGLEDFLRIFLDIRLPFVAFERSVSGRVPGISPRLGSAAAVVHFCRRQGMVYKVFDELSALISARSAPRAG